MELALHKIFAAQYDYFYNKYIRQQTINNYCTNYTVDIDNYLPYINACDADGDTPLILACRYKFDRMIPIMIAAGADANIMNNRTYNCCNEFALRIYLYDTNLYINTDNEILRLLISKTDFNNTMIHNFILHSWVENGSNEKFLELLINNGLDINKKYYNQPILHYNLIFTYSYERINTLLKHGANIDAVDNNNKSIFYIVAKISKDTIINNTLSLLMKYYNATITEELLQKNQLVIIFNERIKLQKENRELKLQLLAVESRLSAISYLPPDSASAEYLAAAAKFAQKK